jgi:hypothetical protein
VFSLVATFIAIVVVRSGALEIVPALSTLGGALALAMLAILLAFGAAVSIWKDGVGGIGEAVTGLLIGLVLIAYPLYVGVKAYKLPAIYDITTDPIDPPRFDAIARLRPRDANPVTYAGLYTAEQQRTAYSDIEPDMTSVAAGSLRRGDEGHHQAQMACGRRPPAAGHRAARRPDRGDRPHADPRLSAMMSPCACAPPTRAPASMFARRRATAATISAPTRARARPDRGYRRRAGNARQRRETGETSAGAEGSASAGGQRCVGQAVSAGERRRASVATTPRATRSSRCASTESAAAPVSRGSMPI